MLEALIPKPGTRRVVLPVICVSQECLATFTQPSTGVNIKLQCISILCLAVSWCSTLVKLVTIQSLISY